MCRLNPRVDFAFKKLFGSEDNKDILISFINSMLSEDQQIKEITLKNPYNIASYKKDNSNLSPSDFGNTPEGNRNFQVQVDFEKHRFHEIFLILGSSVMHAFLAKGRR